MKFNSRNNNPVKPGIWINNDHKDRSVKEHIESSKIHPDLVKFLNSLPEEVQKQIVITEGLVKESGVHSKTTRHLGGTALDIRINNRDNPYLDDVFQAIVNNQDRKGKIVVVDPHHGTAAHIHISVAKGSGEDELDFVYGSRWNNYMKKNQIAQANFSAAQQKGLIPEYSRAYTDLQFNNGVFNNTNTESSLDSHEHDHFEEFTPQETIAQTPNTKYIEELFNLLQSTKKEEEPEVLKTTKAQELLNIQQTRNQIANFVNEYLTLNPTYADYSGNPQQQNIQKAPEQGSYLMEDGGIIKYPNGGTLPPIYVDPNDPKGRARYQVYQDSLQDYNFTAHTIENFRNRAGADFTKYSNANISPSQIKNLHGKDEYERLYVKKGREPIGAYVLEIKDEKNRKDILKNTTLPTSKTIGIYKKPEQPVEYKPDPEIVAKQEQLINAGFDIGKADGIWGKKSQAAWEELEKRKPLDKTNFEQRIQKPTQDIKNSDGTHSTHKMMSFESDGKYYAAPTIVEIDGKLVELSEDEAFEYAMKNKEYKEFPTEKEAQEYAEGKYKEGTPLEKPTTQSPNRIDLTNLTFEDVQKAQEYFRTQQSSPIPNRQPTTATPTEGEKEIESVSKGYGKYWTSTSGKTPQQLQNTQNKNSPTGQKGGYYYTVKYKDGTTALLTVDEYEAMKRTNKLATFQNGGIIEDNTSKKQPREEYLNLFKK